MAMACALIARSRLAGSGIRWRKPCRRVVSTLLIIVRTPARKSTQSVG
ncbi:hypothetical protein BH09VER1_BH09VER1_53910 [soil metagenome]